MCAARGTLLLLCAAFALMGTSARADIGPATTIDGPGADTLELHGASMAPDGTGGVVYTKRVDGRTHVFAARFSGGRWSPPQRVDVGQQFNSSWPAIGAGDGGRLVVTWAHDFGAGSDRLFSASLDPGATRFQAPVLVDINIGEASATYPSLAMNGVGTAYLAYRVVTDSGESFPRGLVSADTRVARYNGGVWSVLGQVADRNPNQPVREPRESNRPRVGIDRTGGGVIAFQEPDDELIDRIWARRIFGSNLGIPLLVSPAKLNEQPLRGNADQPALDVNGFGAAAVAFRQSPGESGPLKGTRVMLAALPEVFTDTAGVFGAARIVDGGGEAGPVGVPAAPSVGHRATGQFLSAFGLGNATMLVSGDDKEVATPERLDDGRSSAESEPEVDVAASGALVAAWRAQVGNRGGVSIVERRSDGVPASRSVSAERGGVVGPLLLAGSGLGDGIVAFTQGTAQSTQLAVSVVDAPPGDFFASTPVDWYTRNRLKLHWDPAPSGITSVTYTVQVDDQAVAEGLRRPVFELGPGVLDEGVLTVQVVATDRTGQQTASAPEELRVDRTAPRATVTRRGRIVTVAVTDGEKGDTSGVDSEAFKITWGDGRRTTTYRRRSTHRYSRGGTRQVTIVSQDLAGNRAGAKRTVRLP